jgi:hypothetical protein
MKRAVLLLLAGAVSLVGCGGPPEASEVSLDGKSDQLSLPLGTYHKLSGTDGQLRLLALKSSMKMHAEIGPTEASSGIDGGYALSASTWGWTHYLRLITYAGTVQRYSYTVVAGVQLHLRDLESGQTETLLFSGWEWCGVAADCEKEMACEGRTECIAQECHYCVPEPPRDCQDRACSAPPGTGCGDATCTGGTVCCDSLKGICAPPGVACAS